MCKYNSKTYKDLDWLYGFICKETLTEPKEGLTKEELEYEIDFLLMKYNCEPL